MEAKRFKVSLAVLALVVLALSGCASKSHSSLTNGAGSGGLSSAMGGAPGAGEPGAGGDVGGGGEQDVGGAQGGGVPGVGGAQCVAVAPGAGGAATEADIDAEEQEVYAALLAQKYPAPFYVLQSETGVDAIVWSDPPLGGLEALDAILAGMSNGSLVSSETTASFAARNATAYPVATDMNIGAPYALITDEEAAQLRTSFSPFGWRQFADLPEWQARYPGAKCIMQLSRVGFNSTLDQALVYAGTDYGTLNGEGDFYILQKCTSGWLVTYKRLTWVS